MRAFASAVALAGLLACGLAQVPGVVVVQSGNKKEIVEGARPSLARLDPSKAPGTQAFDAAKFENSLIPLPIVEVTAQGIDEDGRLTPICWALTDPVFRAAIEERIIPTSSETPSLSDVFSAMPKLRVGYVLHVSAFMSEGRVWTVAHLYKGEKEIWKDEIRNWQVETLSQFDADNAKRSIARTWVQLLANGPLKDLPQRRRVATPAAGPGTALQNDVAPPPAPPDNQRLFAEVKRMMDGKQVAEAVNVLRDAVDAEPADMERRQGLVAALLQTGEPELAAREARRAADLMPEKVQLRVLAARAWLEAGKEAEAEQDLNEAVTRDPDGRDTRLLLGEIQVSLLRIPLAIEHFGKVLEKAPSAYVLRLRAFAHAAHGDEEAARADLASAASAEVKETDPELRTRARIQTKAALALGEEIGTEVRGAIQKIRLAPADPQHEALLESLAARLRAITEAMATLGGSSLHREARDRLVLALKLLAQSTADLQGALKQPNEDALTEATISLGEGLKALESAKSAFETASA